ncbi:MAG TPA: oxidoreductase [Gammaproteobacteria bacterium]|nr:oxidoreductase [Gammaproteobacteria bacterium]
MKICIYGAGAIGGFLGARLGLAGVDVSLVARGPHLTAIREHGVRLLSDGGESICRVSCTDDPNELGIQDYVVIGLKAQSVPAAVDQIETLCGKHTVIVPAVNGIPWWYFYGLDCGYEGRRIHSVDPSGNQWNTLKPERVIGCVVYPSCEVLEPGVIEHLQGERFVLGEITGEKSKRLVEFSQVLRNAGLKAPIKTRIRDEIWIKLWGNVAFNPISVLTGATLDSICADPNLRAIARSIMIEAQSIGEALGARFNVSIDQRIDGAEAVGAHKTSMLQDLERGRPMEIDAVITAVQELGRLVDIATPTIDIVLALVQTRAREAGCY